MSANAMNGSRAMTGAHTRACAVLARLAPAAAAAVLLGGCVTTETRLLDGSVVAESGLYAGEPTALHATELPVATAAEARARAREALAARDVDLALYLFVQAVSLDPDDADSLFAIGAIHAERGNAELAVKAYKQVVELEPENWPARQELGIALFDGRQFAAAEPHLAAAVGGDPSLWRARNTLGIIADRRRDYLAAIAHYTTAIELQPAVASIRNNRGYSHYLAGDIPAAKTDFLEALEIDPGYERAWRNLGLALAREQDYQRALSAMSNAIPRHVALNDIGYIAMLDGNLATAQRFFEDAIIASPRHYQTAQNNLTEVVRRRSASPDLVATD